MRARLGLFGDDGRLAAHGFGDGLRVALDPDPVGAALRIVVLLERRIEPLAFVLPGLGVEGGAHLPVVARDVLADLSSRSTTIDSVGVCTRPTVVRKKPPSRELNAVIARVPLMPTSQSASGAAARRVGERQHLLVAAQLLEALADGGGVMLCSHSRDRFVELSLRAAGRTAGIRRKISSPSRPASQALTISVTSLRRICLTTALSRDLALSIGARSKCGGITGRWAKLHLPRLTSYSSGRLDFTRWPTAEVTTSVVLEVVVVLVELARHRRQRTDDVLRDRRLLRDDQ